MAVSEDYNIKSRLFGLQIQFVQVVEHIDRNSADFKHIRRRDLLGPRFPIHIAADRCYGRNLRQRFQDQRIADVASMNDVIRTTQSGKGLRAKQSVRIGDDADDHHCPRRGRCPHLPGRAKLGSETDATLDAFQKSILAIERP